MTTMTANLQTAIDLYSDGITCMQQGDLQGAILFWNQALRIFPDYVEALEHRGAARRMLGDLQGALTDVNDAINLHPDRIVAYWVRGDIYATQGKYELAIADYQYLAQHHANQIPIALIHDSLAKWRDMLQMCMVTPVTIRVAESDVVLYPTNSSTSQPVSGRLESVSPKQEPFFRDSEEDVIDATFRSLNPSDLVHHARTLLHAGRHREALSELNRAIEQDSLLVEAFVERGALYTTLAAIFKAQLDLDRALVLRPNHVQALAYRAHVEIMAEKPRQGLPYLQKAFDLDANEAAVHNIYGAFYEAEGKFAEAFAAYAHAATLDPESTAAYANRGRMYMKYQLPRKALPDFLRALQLQPTNARTHVNIGQIYVGRGDFDEALKYFEQAANLGYESAKQTLNEIRSRRLPAVILSATPEWQPTSSELLADALLRMSVFVYASCGPNCWQEQTAKKSMMGLTTKSVQEMRQRWHVSMETSTEIDNRRLARNVQAAVLDLLQSPAALLRVEVVDNNNYMLSLWTERAVSGAKAPIFHAGPENRLTIAVAELSLMLDQLLEQQILVNEGRSLRYSGRAFQSLT